MLKLMSIQFISVFIGWYIGCLMDGKSPFYDFEYFIYICIYVFLINIIFNYLFELKNRNCTHHS